MTERETLAHAIEAAPLRSSRREAARRLLDLWPGRPAQISEQALLVAFEVRDKDAARRSAKAMAKAGIPITLIYQAGQITINFSARRIEDQATSAPGSGHKASPTPPARLDVMAGFSSEKQTPGHKGKESGHKRPDPAISQAVTAGLTAGALVNSQRPGHKRRKPAISQAVTAGLTAGALVNSQRPGHKEQESGHNGLNLDADSSHSLYSQLVSNTDPIDQIDPDNKLTTYSDDPATTAEPAISPAISEEEEEEEEPEDAPEQEAGAIVDPGIFTPPKSKPERLAGFRHLTHPLIGLDAKTAKRLSDEFSVETIRRACQKYQAGNNGKPWRSAGILITWLDGVKAGQYRLPYLEPAYLKGDLCQDCRTPQEIADDQKSEEERQEAQEAQEAQEREIRARERMIEKERARKAAERDEQLATMRQGEGVEEAAEIWRAEIKNLRTEAQQNPQAASVLAMVDGSDAVARSNDKLIIASAPGIQPQNAARVGGYMARLLRAAGEDIRTIEFR